VASAQIALAARYISKRYVSGREKNILKKRGQPGKSVRQRGSLGPSLRTGSKAAVPSKRPDYHCFGSNSAVVAALTLPPFWVRERYAPTVAKRQILSTSVGST